MEILIFTNNKEENMKIYAILFNQSYENWDYKEGYDVLFLNTQFRGKKVIGINEPLKVETCFKGEKAEAGEISDIANVGVIPIFKPHAKKLIEDYVKDLVEWVAFKHDIYGICYGMNALNVIDCIDEKRSKLTPHHFNEKYEMKSKNIPFSLVFKIPNDKKLCVFCTEEFKNIIEDNRLKGLAYELIWESK